MTRWRPFVFEHDLVLLVGGVFAILWASTDAVTYFQTAQALAFWVNDVGMAFVFAYVAQEAIEAAMPGGTLHPWRSALVPLAAGVGGSLGAVALYATYVHAGDESLLVQGWPIVCAVDVLLSLAVARWIFGRSAPAAFVLVLALVTDVLGLAAVSGRHQIARLYPAAGLLIAPAIAACVILRSCRVRSIWPYVLLAGPLSWVACYATGVHPALALLPIVPFLPHAPRDLTQPAQVDPWPHASPTHFEHAFRRPVQVIGFLFVVANVGVLMRGFGTGTWAVLLASLVGRPVGILAAAGLAIAAGLHVPRVIGWRELLVIALAATPGLAFGVFLAAAVFPPGPLLIETKIGALSTFTGALPALAAARLLRVGRFRDLVEHRPAVDLRLTRGHA